MSRAVAFAQCWGSRIAIVGGTLLFLAFTPVAASVPLPIDPNASGCDDLCRFVSGDYCSSVDPAVISAAGQSGEMTISTNGSMCQINGQSAPLGIARSCDEVAAQGRVCGLALSQAKPYCTSYDLQKVGSKAYNWNWALLVSEAATATLCWVACGYKPLEGVCTAVGIGLGIFEGVAAGKVATDGEFQKFMTMAAPIGAGLGALGPAAINLVSDGALKSSESSNTSASSCISAGIYTILAGLRIPNIVTMTDRAGGDCRQVRGLVGRDVDLSAVGWDIGNVSEGGGGIGPGGSSIGNGANVATGGSTGSSSDELVAGAVECLLASANPGDCERATQSAAMEGGWGKVGGPLGGKPPRVNLPATDWKKIIRAARTGGTEGLSQALGTDLLRLSGASDAFARLAKASDEASKNPEKYAKALGVDPSQGVAGALASANGRPAPDKKKGLFLDWGARTPPSISTGGGAAVLKFDAAQAKLDPEAGDIFHETFKGSIFEIVSYRLSKTRERVVELEWQTPLNRALTGLKNSRPVVEAPTRHQR